MSFSRKFAVGALALTVSACASTARRVPSPWDPSNPEAPSSPVRALTALSASALAPPAAPPTAPPAGYVCPMHPDVTAHEAGRCPRCGMKLVPQGAPPRDESASRDPAHGHDHGGLP